MSGLAAVLFENNMVLKNFNNNSEGDYIEYWQANLLRGFQ